MDKFLGRVAILVNKVITKIRSKNNPHSKKDSAIILSVSTPYGKRSNIINAQKPKSSDQHNDTICS